MANENRGETTIALGGADYTLRPTFEALSEMESRSGLGIIELAQRCMPAEFGGNFKFTTKDVHAILVAGIKAGGGKPPANLGQLILEAGIANVAGKCGAFLLNALAGGAPEGNAEAAKE